MKRCPECRRDYYDDSLLYCLDDGTPLLEGPGSVGNESATAILHETVQPVESATHHQIHLTDRTRDLPTTSIPAERPEKKRARKLAYGLIALTVLASAVGGFLWYRASGTSNRLGADMKLSRLITGIQGRPHALSISPDGKYIVYAIGYEGKASLWLRQLSQNASLQLLPPAEKDFYRGTEFSRNGDLIYYIRGNTDTDPRGSLYQVPVLGGVEPKKVLDFVSGDISLSPDGKQFTFVRKHEKGSTDVMVASFDGASPERIVASRSADQWYEYSAWSPDGATIAVTTGTVVGGASYGMVVIPAAGGDEKPLGTMSWGLSLDPPKWRPNGRHLLITASMRSGSRFQLYSVSYPAGELSRITNDTNDYYAPEATAQGDTLAAVSGTSKRNIWSVDISAPNGRSTQLTNGEVVGAAGLDVLPDGRVAYTSEMDDSLNLWIVNPDGSGAKQLTTDTETSAGTTAAGPDGTIFFGSLLPDRVPHIWRVAPDGSNLRQVTTGEDYHPNVSSDGQWLFYNSFVPGTGFPTLRKLPLAGGEPVQITKTASSRPVLSPDARYILYWLLDETAKVPRQRPALMNADDGQLIRMFELPRQIAQLRWTRDGKGYYYADVRDGVANIWMQPIDGGPPKQVTSFTADSISNFASSPDGKTMYLSRGTGTSEIVLIKDFR